MTTVFADLTLSLEGFVAGPDPSLEAPLGVGGEELHEWAFALDAVNHGPLPGEEIGHGVGDRGVVSSPAAPAPAPTAVLTVAFLSFFWIAAHYFSPNGHRD